MIPTESVCTIFGVGAWDYVGRNLRMCNNYYTFAGCNRSVADCNRSVAGYNLVHFGADKDILLAQ